MIKSLESLRDWSHIFLIISLFDGSNAHGAVGRSYTEKLEANSGTQRKDLNFAAFPTFQ